MHSNEEGMSTKLQRIAERASRDKHCQFSSLFHLMNKDLLLECFMQLRKNAASGIDNISKEGYAANLEENLDNLVRRLHQMAYRPQPVLRVYIPKPGSHKQRPLGIPALEDKLVQRKGVKSNIIPLKQYQQRCPLELSVFLLEFTQDYVKCK